MTLTKSDWQRIAVRNAWRHRQSKSASSDSSQEDEVHSVGQTYTALLQSNEATSTVVQPNNSSQYQDYSYSIPDSAQVLSSQDNIDFEGLYNFKVSHPGEESSKASKGAAWTYSKSLETLFVKMDVDCPVIFNVNGSLPQGTVIKATPYYLRLEDQSDIPRRCLNHSAEPHETNRGHLAVQHLIRCYLPETAYITDSETGLMSTELPYLPPKMGYNFSSYVLRFMCRTSCPGGMNRRPITVAFTLEHNGKCLGRVSRKVRICACPGRDRDQEELRAGGNQNLVREVKKACRRICTSDNNSSNRKRKRTYTLTVNSKAHYNILSALIPILEMNLNQDATSEEED